MSYLDVEKIRDGDEAAIRELFLRVELVVRKVLLGYPGAAISEGDILSDVVLSLLRRPDLLTKLDRDGNLESYCRVAARNMFLFSWRRERREARSLEDYEDELRAMSASHDPGNLADAEVLRRAIEELPELERQCILQRLTGRSLKEISESQGISPSTIARRIRSAMFRLRDTIGDPER